MERDVKRLPYLHSMNILRVLLSLHIMFSHVFPRLLHTNGLPDWFVVLVASSAGISTQIFFVMSGFIIAYTYKEIHDRWWKLFIHRIRIVWPTFVISTTAACIYFLAFNPNHYSDSLINHQWDEWWRSIQLIEPWYGDKPLYNIPAWATSVFALGYLTISIGGKHFLKIGEKAWIPMFATMGVSMAVTLWFVLSHPGELSGPYVPLKQYSPTEEVFRHYPAYRWLEILVGIFLGVWFRSNPERWKRNNSRLSIGLTILIPIIVVPLCMWNATSAFIITHGLLLALVVVWLAFFAADSNLLSKWGGNVWMRRISDHSVAIYFAHWPIHRVLENILIHQGWSRPLESLWYIPIYLFSLAVMGAALKWLVDKMTDPLKIWLLKPIVRTNYASEE